MKLTVYKHAPGNYVLSIDVSAEHGMIAQHRFGKITFAEFSAQNVSLAELEAMHKQLGEEIAKAIQER